MSTSSLRPEREEEQPSTSGKHFHDINYNITVIVLNYMPL